jgi:GxxExxY protein
MGRKFETISGRVIEAAIAVHKELGPGFIESIYENALRIELQQQGIPFFRQREFEVFYRNTSVGKHRVDLIVADELLVELKAVRAFEEIHFAQTRAYLKVTKLHVGLLLNFNAPTLAIKRLVRGATT